MNQSTEKNVCQEHLDLTMGTKFQYDPLRTMEVFLTQTNQPPGDSYNVRFKLHHIQGL